MSERRRIQQAITLGALLLAFVHVLWPEVRIDQVTIVLVIIAVIPWLAPIFKALELPGGVKIQFADLEKARDQAIEAGLITTAQGEEVTDKQAYLFETLDGSDPNLVLAALRIDLERRLKQLANLHEVEVTRPGIVALVSALRHEGVFTMSEGIALRDLVRLLNEAVHGAMVDESAVQSAKEVGQALLKTLDQRTADPSILGDPD